jgi:hypothetical protein
MTGQGLSDVLSGLTPEQLSVDEEGRVMIDDPEIAARLREAAGKKPPEVPTNGNCSGCNTTAGCGPATTNTVKGCGTKLAT